MRLLILFLTIILFTNIYAASYMFDNARILSLAGAGGASEALPLQYNPANLNNLNFQLIETNYIRYYNFSDLYKTSLIYGFHTQNLPIKIGLMYDKQSVYDLDQETFIFSSALKINKIYSGINLKKYNFNYQSLGEHDNSYGIDMGIFYPFEQFNIYFVSRNISAAKINFLTFKSSSLGISFYPFKSTQINIDYGIEEENKDEFIFSQESQIFSKLYLRYGLQSNSHKYGIGVGTKFEFWSLDYGLLSHQTLDQTHAFTISIAF